MTAEKQPTETPELDPAFTELLYFARLTLGRLSPEIRELYQNGEYGRLIEVGAFGGLLLAASLAIDVVYTPGIVAIRGINKGTRALDSWGRGRKSRERKL